MMSQYCVCDITVCCTCVFVMERLHEHNIMDVQHYISKIKSAQFRRRDSSEAEYLVPLNNRLINEFPMS